MCCYCDKWQLSSSLVRFLRLWVNWPFKKESEKCFVGNCVVIPCCGNTSDRQSAMGRGIAANSRALISDCHSTHHSDGTHRRITALTDWHTHACSRKNKPPLHLYPIPCCRPSERRSDGGQAVKDFRPLASLIPAKGVGRKAEGGAADSTSRVSQQNYKDAARKHELLWADRLPSLTLIPPLHPLCMGALQSVNQ